MPEPGIKELLEAGLHFGHQTRRWDPAHAPVHLRGARRDPHHRPAADRAAARRGAAVRRRRGQQGRDGPLRRHQEAGPRLGQGVGGALRHAVREPAVARRPVDQLPHDVGADRPPARADDAREEGQLDLLPTKERMAREAELAKLEYNLGGVRGHEAAAAGGADHRPEDRGDRRARGRAAANPDHRPGRLERRSRSRSTIPIPGNDDSIRSCELVVETDRRGGLRGGAVVARRPRPSARPRRRSAAGARRRSASAARPRSGPARRPRRRPPGGRRRGRGQPQAAPAEAGQEPSVVSAAMASDRRRRRQGAPGAHRRRDHGLQGRARRGAAATSTRRSRSCASRGRRRRRSAAAEPPARASSPPTSTRPARSACWSRSSARRTSSPAATSSRSSPARWRSTSRAPDPPPIYVSAEEIPDEAREAERGVFEAKAREEGKPDDVIDEDRRRPARQVGARRSPCSSRSTCATDRYEGKTIEELRAELASKTGENMRIARFARFVVGE